MIKMELKECDRIW